jgi:type II secretory pathway pseudopilin PulG
MNTKLDTGCGRGFTLLELLVILVLLGTAATVIIPSFSGGMLGLQLETSSRNLITRMRQARVDAVAQQSVFRVVLGTAFSEGSEYSLVDEYGRETERYELPKGISLTAEEELPVTISFYPNGRSSGGRIVLKREGGRALTIDVDPITGFGKVIEKKD